MNTMSSINVQYIWSWSNAYNDGLSLLHITLFAACDAMVGNMEVFHKYFLLE